MSQLGLAGIRRFDLPRKLLRDAQAALQTAGVEGGECFVLLTGVVIGRDLAMLRSADVPLQLASSHERGLSVTVPGDELHRLNVLWANRSERLMMQIHSHPTAPYHSSVDSRFPMVTVLGGLSIVVPLFGFCDMSDLKSLAVYRLEESEWRWLDPAEVDQLIRLV